MIPFQDLLRNVRGTELDVFKAASQLSGNCVPPIWRHATFIRSYSVKPLYLLCIVYAYEKADMFIYIHSVTSPVLM